MPKTTSSTLLDRVNALREKAGQRPLKKSPGDDKLNDMLAKLAPPKYRSPIAEYARSKGVDPKVARSLLRRHYASNDGKWDTLTDEIKAKIDEQAARRKQAA